MSNHPSYSCPFCDVKISYNYIFKHFLNIHKKELYDEQTAHGKLNRVRLLACSKNLKPVTLELPSKSSLLLSGCYGCYYAVKSPRWAVKHYPKCCKQATENIKTIKEELGISTGEETKEMSEVSSLSSLSSPSLDPELEVFYLRTIKHLLSEIEESRKKLKCWNRAAESYLEGVDLDELKEKVDSLEHTATTTRYNMTEDPEFIADSDELPVYEEIIKQARTTRF